MSVQEYLDKHMLSRKIEDAVNAAVRAKAQDPVLFISNHMNKSVTAAISKIKARQIFDSRGIPIIEVDLFTNKGMFRAAVPGDVSADLGEVIELRNDDGAKDTRKAVLKAVRCINEKVSVALNGMDPTHQSQIDQALIDLEKSEKGELGANAILAVSVAACRAGASEKAVSLYKYIADLSGRKCPTLPVPTFTVISGGKHSVSNLPVREIMILPVGAHTFEEAMQMGTNTFHQLKSVIMEKHGSAGCVVSEDGGFAPNVSSFADGLDLVLMAIDKAGYNDRIKLALGVFATDFCTGKKYDISFKPANGLVQNFKTGEELIEMYTQLCAEYPIVSLEEPFDKDDWEHTKLFCSLGLCQVAGDKLLMSNPKFIERAIQETACNSLILKVNSVSTVMEAIEVVKLAKDAHWGIIVSCSCGETDDPFLADFAAGMSVGQMKAGSPCRGECLAKYNQLLRIEEELGDEAVYAGESWRVL